MPMVENEVRNMHDQGLRSVHLVDKSTTPFHFGWGATEGSPDSISTMPFNVRRQRSIDPQKTTHSIFQLKWYVPL